jgi:8-oxo-dGTP pyrophosphatase MutT (NUDIX family)
VSTAARALSTTLRRWVTGIGLPRSRVRFQVAAICYRIQDGDVSFLLVRTRSGRWTFPKGGVDPGLSCAESAAREAFEEAGVYGRIAPRPLMRYLHSKRTSLREGRRQEMTVEAYLLQVLRQGTPLEDGREPTWFSPEKARKRLADGRSAEYAEEIVAVIDRALHRILRHHR